MKHRMVKRCSNCLIGDFVSNKNLEFSYTEML